MSSIRSIISGLLVTLAVVALCCAATARVAASTIFDRTWALDHLPASVDLGNGILGDFLDQTATAADKALGLTGGTVSNALTENDARVKAAFSPDATRPLFAAVYDRVIEGKGATGYISTGTVIGPAADQLETSDPALAAQIRQLPGLVPMVGVDLSAMPDLSSPVDTIRNATGPLALIGVIAAAAAVFLSPNRPRTAARFGRRLIGAAAGVAILLVAAPMIVGALGWTGPGSALAKELGMAWLLPDGLGIALLGLAAYIGGRALDHDR